MIWQRLRNLWRLSGISVDAYEFPIQRKQVINKVTDVFKPEKSELPILVESHKDRQNAKIISRKKRDPIKEIIGEESAL